VKLSAKEEGSFQWAPLNIPKKSYVDVFEVGGINQELHLLIKAFHYPGPISSDRAMDCHHVMPVAKEVPIQSGLPIEPFVNRLDHCPGFLAPGLHIFLRQKK